jgi:endonuclease/exonuclease/phosphatase family metal-dependent hydrolase
MKLRLATYNIHAGVGTDRKLDMARIADVINSLNADIIALQEVEHQLIEEQHLLLFLAHETGFKAYSGITFTRGEYEYGNVLLSKKPITSIELHDISIEGREPRGLIEANLKVNNTEMMVLATHLGLQRTERKQQVQKIMQLMENKPNMVIALMGDFNEWLPFSSTLNPINTFFGFTSTLLTFPSRWSFLSLDKIWISVPRHDMKLTAIKTTLTKKASDHLPLIAEIELD